MKNWFRISEWWNSKIVALIGIAYCFAIEGKLSFTDFLPILLFLFIWMVLSAALGYYINDIFDLKQDLEVQKENHSKHHNLIQQIAIASFLMASILLSWYTLNGIRLVLFLILLQLLLFFLYSSPIIRFKEKPLFGILVDALYAHLIPGLIVLISIIGLGISPIILTFFCLWQIAVGIRNILSHHLVDFYNDSNSGTSTSATYYGKSKIKKIMNFIVSPIELIAFVALLAVLTQHLFWIIPFYLLYIIFTYNRELVFLRQQKTSWSLEEQENYNFIGGVLLNEFYEKWFPVVVLFMLSFTNPVFLVISVLHCLLFYNTIIDFKKDYMIVKNIILSQMYWWFVRHFYTYFLHPVYYKFFGNVKHFIYWKIYAQLKDFLYWEVYGNIYHKYIRYWYYNFYGKLKHFVYWKIYKSLINKNDGE